MTVREGVNIQDARSKAIALSDQMLGRLMRFHPERAVTPKNPLPAFIEAPIPAPTPPPAIVVTIPTTKAIEEVCYIGQPSIKAIQLAVCQFYEIPIRSMLSLRRDAVVIQARHVAMYLSRELTDRSFPEIGRLFGGKDHSTIVHAYNKVKADLQKSEPLRDDLDVLRLRIHDMMLEAA